MTPKIFEKYIYELLLYSQSIAETYNYSVEPEENRHQGGRDIAVYLTGEASILGVPLKATSTKPMRIAIECKLVSGPRSKSAQNQAENVAQNKNGECDCFILVTNGSLTTHALLRFYEEFSRAGHKASIYLIDAPLLKRVIEAHQFRLPEAELELYFENGESPEKINDVGCLLYVKPDASENSQRAEVSVILRNMSDQHRSGTIFLQSLRDFKVSSEEITKAFDLAPFAFTVHTFTLVRDIAETSSAIRLSIECGDRVFPLYESVKAARKLDLGLTLRGAQHRAALQTLQRALTAYQQRVNKVSPSNPISILIASITAPGGTGKSRLIQELREKWFGEARFKWLNDRFDSKTESNQSQKRTDEKDLATFLSANIQSNPRIPLLVLDDVHLASEQVCNQLIQYLEGAAPVAKGVLLIVGRTDFERCHVTASKLLSMLNMKATAALMNGTLSNSREQGKIIEAHVTIDALEHAEFKKMVKEILQDATAEALKAIERLSGRVPFNVLQCIEWLLDMSALRVRFRSHVGVVNTRIFNERLKMLPPSMTELLADRIDVLGNSIPIENREIDASELGNAARLVLAAAALLGNQVPINVLDLADLDTVISLREEVANLLSQRRLLYPTGDGSTLRWHHESLLLHMRGWLLEEHIVSSREVVSSKKKGRNWNGWQRQGGQLATSAAKAILRNPQITQDLTLSNKGLINSLAGNHVEALNSWAPTLNKIERTKGFSTTNLDGREFSHLRWLYLSVEALDGSDVRLPNLAKAMCYVGGYAISLAEGISAIRWCKSRTHRIRNSAWNVGDLFWLDLLEAHFLLDAGYIRESHGKLLHLQARYLESNSLRSDPLLGFEIFNCLGMLYGYQNDLPLSSTCYKIAKHNIDDLALSEKEQATALAAKLKGDESVNWQFINFAEYERMSYDAHQLNQDFGTNRHRKHATIGDLLIKTLKTHEWPDSQQRNEAYLKIMADITRLEKDCKSDSFFSLMPRIALLRAAIYYLLATNSTRNDLHDTNLLIRADLTAQKGIDIGLQRGIGYSSWQLVNLRALIALRQQKISLAIERISQAVEMLRHDGLMFLGQASLTCPNQILLANAIKLFEKYRDDTLISELLDGVTTYQHSTLANADVIEYAIATAKNHHALLHGEKPGPGMILDETLSPPLALLVWY